MFGPGVFATVLVAVRLASAALYTDVKQLPTGTFDFVIIGGRLYLRPHVGQNHLTPWLSSGFSRKRRGQPVDGGSPVLRARHRSWHQVRTFQSRCHAAANWPFLQQCWHRYGRGALPGWTQPAEFLRHMELLYDPSGGS